MAWDRHHTDVQGSFLAVRSSVFAPVDTCQSVYVNVKMLFCFVLVFFVFMSVLKGAQLNWSSSSEQVYPSVLTPSHPTASQTLVPLLLLSRGGEFVLSSLWLSRLQKSCWFLLGFNSPSNNHNMYFWIDLMCTLHACYHSSKVFQGSIFYFIKCQQVIPAPIDQMIKWEILSYPNLVLSQTIGSLAAWVYLWLSAKRCFHFKLFTNVSHIGLCFTREASSYFWSKEPIEGDACTDAWVSFETP